MKKTPLLIFCALLLCGSLHAKPVDANKARQVASAFLNRVNANEGKPFALTDITSQTPYTEFYVFTLGETGFILVSADDVAIPILGYSTTSRFVTKDMPENVAAWYEDYEREIRTLKEVLGSDNEPAPGWEIVENPTDLPRIDYAVTPLITTTWNQGNPYNLQCPTVGVNRAPTGCVATATAQLMKFWNHPATGHGSHSYNHSSAGELSADFGATTYDWDNMPVSLTASSSNTQKTAVATLMYHIGVAVQMNYGSSSSGATTLNYPGRFSTSAQTALMKYFKYKSSMTSIRLENYTSDRWRALLRAELDAGRPVLYSGRNTDGGHAFICDGYNNSNQFHFNWGWGGSHDGDFAIGSLNPGVGGIGGNASGTYNMDNAALIGVEPHSGTFGVGGTVSVSTTGCGGCSVSGAGTYNFGDTVTLLPAATECYRFARWENGCNVGPRIFTPNGGDYNFTAQFERLDGDTLSYCGNQSQASAYRTSSSSSYWGIRLPASLLYNGTELQAVQLYVAEAGAHTFNAYTSNPTTSTPAATATVTFATSQVDSWQTITLATPLALNGTQDLWLTFEYSADPNAFPAAVCPSTGNSDGLLMYPSFIPRLDASRPYTFMIRGIFYRPPIPIVYDTATVPYYTGFEGSEDRGWEFVNNEPNKWYIGSTGGSTELFISNNDGASCTYTTNQSCISFATRTFDLAAGDYNLSFAWKCKGETSWDFLRAFLCPASDTPDASYFTSGASYGVPSGWVKITNNYHSGNSGWTNDDHIFHVDAAGYYKIVFMWRNDDSDGTNPPAAVDNISLERIILPATVPYASGFEEGDDTDWELTRGTSNHINQWYLGTAASQSGSRALYISKAINNGDSNTYDIGYTGASGIKSNCYASRKFTLAAGDYDLSFDWRCNGEGNFDFMRVFLIPDNIDPGSQVFTGSNNARTTTPDGWMDVVGGKLNQQTSWQNANHTFTVSSAGNYKLAFLWYNDNNGGSQPPAAIDNVQLAFHQYTVTAVANDSVMGSVSGGGSYDCNATATLTATANSGYHFVQWQDGNMDNPRTVTVTADTTYTATFEADPLPATVPYYTGFDGSEDRGWLFVNSNPNKWYIGSTGGSTELFISNDGGTSNAYTNNANCVSFATRTFDLTAGQYNFGFSWKCDGEDNYDFLRVFLCPASDTPNPSNFANYTSALSGVPTGWIDIAGGKLNERQNNWTDTNYIFEVTTPGIYKVVFMWRNDGSAGSNPPAAVDNISLEKIIAPATVPYSTGFETTDDTDWEYYNGTTNKWHIGTAAAQSGARALYISNDGGSTNEYNNGVTNYSFVSRPFTLVAGEYDLNFNWRCYGEGDYDFMRVFLCPDSQDLGSVSFTSSSNARNTTPSGWQDLAGGKLNQQSAWQNAIYTFQVAAAGDYKLVFLWYNDYGSGSNPPAAIDNVQLNIAQSQYTITTMVNDPAMGSVSGGGTYDRNATATLTATPNNGYRFMQWHDGSRENPRTFTVLSNATYTATFAPNIVPATVPYSTGFETVDDTNWEFNNSTYINQWHLGTAAYQSGSRALYISNDGGTTNAYDNSATSASIVYRTFTLDTGDYTLNFNWQCNGEEGYDFLRVFLCPGSVDPDYALFSSRTSVPDGWACLTDSPLRGAIAWQSATYSFPIATSGDYHLVFFWYNDNSDGSNPPAAIDNVQLTAFRTVSLALGSDPAWGSISPVGDSIVEKGASFTATATPAPGYHFTAWNEGSTQVSTANPYTFTVTRDISLTAHFAVNSYTLTANSSNNSMGTVSGGGSYDHGATATLTATAATGHHFVQWQDGNTDNPRTVTVTSDATYTATFAPESYTITANSANATMGSVSGGGSYDYNATATLTATPNSGYHFVQWQDGNTDNPRTFIVTANATYTATFEANAPTVTYYSVSVNSLDNAMGTVSSTHSGSVEENTLVTVTATPATGHHFVQWQYGAGQTSTANPYTFTLTGDITLNALFAADTYTITATSSSNTMGSVSGGGEYAYGATATLYATPNSGYHFVQWQDGNTDNPRTVTVTANATYTATFEANLPSVTYYNVTVIADGGNIMGTVSSTHSGSVEENTQVTVTATPATGHHFVQWQYGAGQTSTANPYTFTLTGDITLNALFAPDTYTLTATTNNNTMGSVSGGGEYTYGAAATLTATPNSGYHFVQWQDGNTDNPRIVTVTANATYTATFEANAPTVTYYNVSVNSLDNAMGTVSSTHSGSVEENTQVTVTAAPATGHHFVQWQYGAGQTSTANPYTFTLTGDISLTAIFAVNSYTVTATSADNSMGSVSGGGSYDYNSTATLTATPANGYHFVQWQDGNTDNPRTVTVTANATYTATFEANAPDVTYYNVTVIADGSDMGTVSSTHSGSVAEGTQITVTASPAAGYLFAYWMDETGSQLSAANPYTFTLIRNITVVAAFRPMPAPQCDVPTNVTVSDITPTSATIDWNPGGNEQMWEIDCNGTRYNSSAHPFLLNGLREQTTYTVKVRARCDSDTYSDWSEPITFTTPEQVGIDEVANGTIALHPNPATTEATLTGLVSGAKVEVLDLQGRLQATAHAVHATFTIDVSLLPRGTYFVRVTTEHAATVRKLIVQ